MEREKLALGHSALLGAKNAGSDVVEHQEGDNITWFGHIENESLNWTCPVFVDTINVAARTRTRRD